MSKETQTTDVKDTQVAIAEPQTTDVKDTQVAIAEPQTKEVSLDKGGTKMWLKERISQTTGKVIGYDIIPPDSFELMSAGMMRAHLRNRGLKGKELTSEVNRFMSDSTAKREAYFDVLRAAKRAAGYVPDISRMNAKQTRITDIWIKPKVAKTKDDTKAKLAKLEAELAAEKAKNAALREKLSRSSE